MNKRIYDLSLLAGISLVGAGVATFSAGAALITVGLLVIGLAVFGARVGLN
jgi:hypothetical protein